MIKMPEAEALVIPDIYFETSEMPSASKPTLLYSLEPRGIGTASCESLKSYLFRLADAHRISPAPLVREVLWKLLPRQMLNSYRGFESMIYNYNSPMKPGDVSKSLVNALSLASGTDNLEFLTLAPVSHVLYSRGLVLNKDRYCPICLQDDIHGWKAHGRLIWAMASVSACATHRIKLIDRRCDAPKGKKSYFIKRKRMPGICCDCGSVRFRCNKTVIEQASEHEIWRSEQIGILIENFPQAKTIFSPQKTIQGIKCLVDHYSNGKRAVAARAAGIHKSILWEWAHGTYLPNIEKLLDLCQLNSVSLLSVLKGDPEMITCPKIEIIWTTKSQRIRKPSLSDRELSLKEALKHNPPESFSAICRNIGMAPKSLTINFPELCAKIVARYANYLVASRQEKKCELRKYAENALQNLARRNIRPTMRNIRSFCGKNLLPKSGLRCAFDEVIARHVACNLTNKLKLEYPRGKGKSPNQSPQNQV